MTIDEKELAAFESVCPAIYSDPERELLWKGWQLACIKFAATEANLQTAVKEAWRANAALTHATATLSDLVQFFDEWGQVIPPDSRAAEAKAKP